MLQKLSWEDYPVSRKEFQIKLVKLPSMFSILTSDVKDGFFHSLAR